MARFLQYNSEVKNNYTKLNFITSQCVKAEIQAGPPCSRDLVNLPAGRLVPVGLTIKSNRY